MKLKRHIILTILLLFFTTLIAPVRAEPENALAPMAKDKVSSAQDHAIPPKKGNDSTLSYHELPIRTDDSRSSEPLVNLKDYGIAGEAFYARKDKLNAPYHRCVCPEDSVLKSRKTVAEKLQKVNESLAALGLELFVLDAYRPVSCQKELWSYFLNEAKRALGEKSSEHDLIDYAETFCSNPTAFDPSNYKTWPTHSTGGAVDLTLRRKVTGELIYMGGIFDDASELSFSDHFEDQAEEKSLSKSLAKTAASTDQTSSASAIEARQNRRILYWSMQAQGFANYPGEWWHYDFGTQAWAQYRTNGQSKEAFYGII